MKDALFEACLPLCSVLLLVSLVTAAVSAVVLCRRGMFGPENFVKEAWLTRSLDTVLLRVRRPQAVRFACHAEACGVRFSFPRGWALQKRSVGGSVFLQAVCSGATPVREAILVSCLRLRAGNPSMSGLLGREGAMSPMVRRLCGTVKSV